MLLTACFYIVFSAVSANLLFLGADVQSSSQVRRKIIHFSKIFSSANLPEKLPSLGVRGNYKINGPSMSTASLAPTCSTRLRQLAPKK